MTYALPVHSPLLSHHSFGVLIVAMRLQSVNLIPRHVDVCAVFAYLSALGHITAEQFLTIFTVVISFYFGTQTQKNADVDKADKQDMIS